MKKSFYQKLRCGEPVRILINGDSISEFSGPGEWPTLLCEALCARYGSSVNFDNVSMGGNASYAGWARALYQKDVRYDLMINGYGQNDAEDGFSEAYESIKGMGFDEATAHMQTALAQAAQQHPDDAKRFNLLRQPFHTAAPWCDLVGLALVDNPKERDIRIGTSTFRVRPTGYANGSLKCDIIKDGNPIRGRALNLKRMDPKEMYRIMKGIPVDTSYSALYSRGLLTLREGTPDEFRIFFNRFRDKLRALEPFLEAHTLKR